MNNDNGAVATQTEFPFHGSFLPFFGTFLNHSCEPNVIAHTHFNSTIDWVALR